MLMYWSYRCWMMATISLMAAAVCLRATEVDDTQYADIDDKFQDLFVDRRSLDMYQTSSLEGMCRWMMCPPTSVCRLRGSGRARCVCRPCDVAQLHTGPVCGFDSRTYSNACKLHRVNCRAPQHIDIDYMGACQTSCGGVTCSAGKACIVDQLGLPHCLQCDVLDYCPWDSADQSPVCAADGRTYAGMCRLLEAACHVGRSVRLAYRGHCQVGLTCDKLQCPGGQHCVMNLATSTPVCVDCRRPCYSATLPGVGTFYQLCGTDGRTYNDWCSIVRETCSRQELVETQHFGPCHGDNEGLQLA